MGKAEVFIQRETEVLGSFLLANQIVRITTILRQELSYRPDTSSCSTSTYHHYRHGQMQEV